MKRIDAIIPEKNLDAVNKSLHGIGVTGVTIFDASGRGKNPPMQIKWAIGYTIQDLATTR